MSPIDFIADLLNPDLGFLPKALFVAVMSAVVCGVVGSYVVLRGMAFIGDAVAHAVFPGLAVAFVISGNLVLGGVVAGVLTAVLVAVFSQNRRLREDSVIGVFFVAAFALGIVIISQAPGYAGSLQQFLFGSITGIPDSDLWVVGIAAVVICSVLFLLHKEFVTVSLDRESARAMGLRVFWLDLALYVLVTLAVVISVQTIGNILVLALLITPAATARLLTDRLGVMMALAPVIGAVSAFVGLYLSWSWDVPTGGTIVLVLTAVFLLVWGWRTAAGRLLRAAGSARADAEALGLPRQNSTARASAAAALDQEGPGLPRPNSTARASAAAAADAEGEADASGTSTRTTAGVATGARSAVAGAAHTEDAGTGAAQAEAGSGASTVPPAGSFARRSAAAVSATVTAGVTANATAGSGSSGAGSSGAGSNDTGSRPFPLDTLLPAEPPAAATAPAPRRRGAAGAKPQRGSVLLPLLGILLSLLGITALVTAVLTASGADANAQNAPADPSSAAAATAVSAADTAAIDAASSGTAPQPAAGFTLPAGSATGRGGASDSPAVSKLVDAAWVDRLSASSGVPERALAAYAGAAIAASQSYPSCGLGWNTLAAIAQAETAHGSEGGASIAADGTVSPAIIGPALDGNGVQAIADTDSGRYDGDTTWDRALGPMQFLPGTWRFVAVDGSGDGVADVHNIDDAALGAAFYLCQAGGDLRESPAWIAAVTAYNPDPAYVNRVAEAAAAYAALG